VLVSERHDRSLFTTAATVALRGADDGSSRLHALVRLAGHPPPARVHQDHAVVAVGPRDPGFELRLIANWRPGDPDGDRHTGWVRDGWDRLAPYAAGQFATFLSDEPDGARTAYGDRLARLTALKNTYDPQNVFHRNVNIAPTEGEPR